MTPQTIIFCGRSGCGKGTQAELIKKYLEEKDPARKVIYAETGARFREFTARDTYTGKLTKEILAQGGLLPEFLPIWVWTGLFIDNYTGNEHIITVGLARRANESPVLDSALRFYKRISPDVVIIDVSDKWASDHLLGRGRYDDNQEEINKRLRWYEDNVVPAIKFFENNSDYYKIHHINGEQTIEEVQKEIRSKIWRSLKQR